MIVKGKTSSGFKYAINKDIKDDYDFVSELEILEGMKEDGKGTMLQSDKVLRAFFGDEQFEAFKKHIKEKNGGVTKISVIMAEFREICANPELKN